jgi:hypothetical protein
MIIAQESPPTLPKLLKSALRSPMAEAKQQKPNIKFQEPYFAS